MTDAQPTPPPETHLGAAPEQSTETYVHSVPNEGTFWGLGRRKSAVARVRILPGEGQFKVNNRPYDNYFSEEADRANCNKPLEAVKASGRYNVFVNVKGGGPTGQSGAVLLGLARALVEADPKSEPRLREAGYLTRDARRVERKKYGRRKARRRFQFSKR